MKDAWSWRHPDRVDRFTNDSFRWMVFIDSVSEDALGPVHWILSWKNAFRPNCGVDHPVETEVHVTHIWVGKTLQFDTVFSTQLDDGSLLEIPAKWCVCNTQISFINGKNYFHFKKWSFRMFWIPSASSRMIPFLAVELFKSPNWIFLTDFAFKAQFLIG